MNRRTAFFLSETRFDKVKDRAPEPRLWEGVALPGDEGVARRDRAANRDPARPGEAPATRDRAGGCPAGKAAPT